MLFATQKGAPQTALLFNIGNYLASVFLERLGLQFAGARLR